MDPITVLTLQTLGLTPADIVYILTHSEQADALQVGLASYKATVQAIVNQVIPPRP